MKSLAPIAFCLALAAALPLGATSPPVLPAFDVRSARMERSEALYLERLFELLEVVAITHRVTLRRLVGDAGDGLHVEDHRERVEELLGDVQGLRTPPRLDALESLLVAAVREQGDFLADWQRARDEGRTFDSQLTSEYGYHEGLHASQRKLLDAYGRMLALFPRESDAHRRAFHHRLCALDLACGGAAR